MPITAAHQVVAQPVSWLWPGFLPGGKLVIMDGDPDLGKSLIALDLCARLSTGRPFPDGQAGAGPANALVLSAEDTAADIVVPRLLCAGADMQRVFVWKRQHADEEWPWRFPAQVGKLDEALTSTDARLAVIDPIMAFLDRSVLCTSDPSVRRLLQPLADVAEKHRCTVLMHRHLNKQAGGRAVYRGLGSVAFVATCRFAMAVGRDPLAPEQYALAPVRHSLAAPQPSLAYQIRAAAGGLATIDWLGTTVSDADDLMAGTARKPRDRSLAFLLQFLAAGPRTTHDIWQTGQRLGLSVRTMQRARKDLGIRNRRVTEGDRRLNYWLLYGQKIPRDLNDPLDLFFDEFENKYPGDTPLDDDEEENPPSTTDTDDR